MNSSQQLRDLVANYQQQIVADKADKADLRGQSSRGVTLSPQSLPVSPLCPHDTERGLGGLIGRFFEGQRWLQKTNEELNAMPDAGVGSDLERRYIAAIDLILKVENTMRYVYQHKGCARGAHGLCADDAIVRCMSCVRVIQP
jgi:hypothetical protein